MRKKATFSVCLAGITIVSTAIIVSILPALLASAQEEETRYFEETRHSVSGEFLRFYDQHGGLAILGYPLTRKFVENGREVQYFQRVRMEYHPRNRNPYKVQLGLLGDQLGYRQSPIPESEIPPANHSDKRYFGETGHTVSFAFLAFYGKNGGLDVFGYPVTEWIIEDDGRIVQYFQRAKMEWYPENPPGKRVQLGMLGTIYVEQFVDPRQREREPLASIKPQSIPSEAPGKPSTVITSDVTDIRIRVTLKHPIIGLKSKQTAYVYVLDQSNHGVKGATVQMGIQYKGGRVERFALGETNANGYCQIEFSTDDPAPGYVVIVNLTARYDDLKTQTSSAFLPWW